MTNVGYARCSTDHQDYAGQVDALKAAGCDKVYAEKISGTVTDRRELARAVRELGPGDVLIVTKLDRLARSLKDLLVTLDHVAKAGAGFKCIDVPALDTTSPYGQLLLGVLGSLAQFERSLILSRTAEGRQRAKLKGVRFGRKHSLTRHQQIEALRRRANGEDLRSIARSYRCSHSTISRLTKGGQNEPETTASSD
jgi:DNA invertase Pin-like site-specific DNA recombinase